MAFDVGTLRLLDYQVPVPGTGIIFVAALSGYLAPNGVATFDPDHITWTKHRAASQIAFMGLISGATFAFMRGTVPLTVAEASAIVGYPTGDIDDWEAGLDPVPVSAWQALADLCCQIDGRPGVTQLPLSPDFRPRVIRIVPHLPYKDKPEYVPNNEPWYPC